MEKKNKVYLVQGWNDYANWIPNVEIVDSLNEANIVMFEGGEDVDPSLYNELDHPYTSSNIKRDLYEEPMFKEAIKKGKYIIGICRGSQLACVINGGILVQHQENKYGKHLIETYDNKSIEVTSSHHQAQYPFRLPKEDYKILGWSKGLSRFHQGGDKKEMNPEVECEIVYYPKTKCLAIQSHPEWQFPPKNNEQKETIDYMQGLIRKLLNNEL